MAERRGSLLLTPFLVTVRLRFFGATPCGGDATGTGPMIGLAKRTRSLCSRSILPAMTGEQVVTEVEVSAPRVFAVRSACPGDAKLAKVFGGTEEG